MPSARCCVTGAYHGLPHLASESVLKWADSDPGSDHVSTVSAHRQLRVVVTAGPASSARANRSSSDIGKRPGEGKDWEGRQHRQRPRSSPGDRRRRILGPSMPLPSAGRRQTDRRDTSDSESAGAYGPSKTSTVHLIRRRVDVAPALSLKAGCRPRSPGVPGMPYWAGDAGLQ